MPTLPSGAQMTAATGSEIPIDGPALQEPVTGLLAQVPVLTGPEAERWLAGLSVVPEVSGAPEFTDLCSVLPLLNTANRVAPRKIQPFGLVVRDRCSTWGWSEADYVGRATRALAVKRHWGVEREFEGGALVGTNMFLADTYTDPATTQLAAGANVSPSDALALLDESIGNSPAVIGRGMIFATPFVAAKWKGAGMLNYENVDDDAGVGSRATILSPAGNHVIIGGGFEGRGPDGNVPGAHASQWAYATDPVAVVASAPETIPGTFAEATAKNDNYVVYRQFQWFAVVWPGLHHSAVKVSTATATIV